MSFTRAIAATGKKPQENYVDVDAALIDTGSSTLSTVGENLVTGAHYASVRPTHPRIDAQPRPIGGIGATVTTMGTMTFYFHFGGRECSINLFIVPGFTPLIFSHKD